MKSILPDDDSYLTRFLFDIENKIPPKLEDLKAIADALIAMNDQGASFKKAFGTTAPSGRKPSKTKHLPRTESFHSMSEGWLGKGPFWLNRFLSKVNQERIPEINDLKCMAQALTELKNGESLVAAFNMRKKTSCKVVMKDEINLNRFYKSKELEVFLLYRKHQRKINGYEKNLCKLSDITGYSDRHIWRMIERISEYAFLLDIAKRNQKENWKVYASFCRYLNQFDVTENAISIFCREPANYHMYWTLIGLYDEVIKNQKYALIMTGKRQYPSDLKRQVKANLEPIVKLARSYE